LLIESYETTLRPGKEIVIDKSMLPWRGRLIFRQYIPGKRHKFAVKSYKLCLTGGYTYNIEIYTGKNEYSSSKGASHDVVMRLIRGLLYEGRILYTRGEQPAVRMRPLKRFKLNLLFSLNTEKQVLK
jgi:hypothetical protein